MVAFLDESRPIFTLLWTKSIVGFYSNCFFLVNFYRRR